MLSKKEQNIRQNSEITKSDTGWLSVRKDIEANIEKMLADKRLAKFYYDEDDEKEKNEAREKLLENEQYFVEHVLEALH